MPITYTEAVKLTNDSTFQQRLQAAIYILSTQLVLDGKADAKLMTWAQAQFKGISPPVQEVARRLLGVPAVLDKGAAIDDAGLSDALRLVVKDLAGADTAPPKG